MLQALQPLAVTSSAISTDLVPVPEDRAVASLASESLSGGEAGPGRRRWEARHDID